MTDPDFRRARWRKSTVSGDSGCVEVAYADGAIGVRDSKEHGTGPVLVFTQAEWSAFLHGVRASEFDAGHLTD